MDREPFGFPAFDLWHGIACATGISPHLKRGVMANPHHYMVRPPLPREMTAEETIAHFRAALGGASKKKV
jgi:hypothetical protein